MAVSIGGIPTFAPGTTPPSIEVTSGTNWTIIGIKVNTLSLAPSTFLFYRDSSLTDPFQPDIDMFGGWSSIFVGITYQPFSDDTEAYGYAYVINNNGAPFWVVAADGNIGEASYEGYGADGIVDVGVYITSAGPEVATNVQTLFPGPLGDFDPDCQWVSIGYTSCVSLGLTDISPSQLTDGIDSKPAIADQGAGLTTAVDAYIRCLDNPPFQDPTGPFLGFLQLLSIDVTPEPPDDQPLTRATHLLHIPYKDYARENQSSSTLTPYAQHQFLANMKAIESWADQLRCSGTETITPPELPPYEVEYTPTNGKWKERQLHIPHKEQFTSRHVRENYLAIERWANLICPTLHIPHKDWVLMGGPEQEQVNLLTIERWAREISRCCEGIETDVPPDG